MAEISTKPYLLRAIYEWCVDNGYTPYIAVKVDARAGIPRDLANDDEVVFNISFSATSGLKMENDFVRFQARFGSVAREIVLPVENISAIYASENGQGMAFDVTSTEGAEATPLSGNVDSATEPPGLSAVPSPEPSPEDGEGPDETPPPRGGRPTLTRVK